MKTQYDNFVQEYSEFRQSDVVRYVEVPTFLSLIGDIRGKSILDLACGDGFYSRQLMQLGATEVLGIDISSSMIERANWYESANPLGVRYKCADVVHLPDLGNFDIIIAAFLLHYSANETILLAMCENIAKQSRPGTRFISMNENPDQSPGNYMAYRQYGFIKTIDTPQLNGSEISYQMAIDKKPFMFQVQYFSKKTYTTALERAGFADVAWHPLFVSAEGIEAKGEEFWTYYLENPPVIGLSATLS